MGQTKFENIQYYATIANDPNFFFRKLIADSEVQNFAKSKSSGELIQILVKYAGKKSANSIRMVYACIAAIALTNATSEIGCLAAVDVSYLQWGKELVSHAIKRIQTTPTNTYTAYSTVATTSSFAERTTRVDLSRELQSNG